MNPENFIVRMHQQTVTKFKDRGSWEKLTEADVKVLQGDIADLPNELPNDQIESRLFDLTLLRMQIAHAESDGLGFEGHRKRVVEIAGMLEEKSAIPAVKIQLEYMGGMG